ncbi:CHAT domain-containing protein [Nocardia sp. NPDC051929]|uniref:CHAT domain-containing protein n=1 Tax=Nocardia sp. NPDC051929 TaxID=3364327 RepID=UPI0037CB76EB
MDELSFERPPNPWGWYVEQAADDTLSVRCPDNEPLVPALDVDLPPGWEETAKATREVMLVVSHMLSATDDPLSALAGEIGNHSVCAGLIRFGAPEFRVDKVTVWNPLGELWDLTADVAQQIISLDEAKRRARVLAQDEFFCAAFEDTIDSYMRDEIDRPGIFGSQYTHWRLVTEVADACGAEKTWQIAAKRTVEAAVEVVAEQCDRAVFNDAEAVNTQLIARQSNPVDALVAGARLRLASRGPTELGADEYAHVVQTTGVARLTADLYRWWFTRGELFQKEIPRLIKEAAALLTRALELDGATPLLMITLAQIYMDENGVNQDAAVAAMSLGATTPDLALFLFRVVDGAGEPQVFTTPFEEFVTTWGRTVTMKVISQGVNLARERADQRLLRTVLDWADRLDVRWDAAHRRQLIEARAHVLPDDPTSCHEPAMSMPDAWTPAQRTAAMLHAAAHARDRREPAMGLTLLRQVKGDRSDVVGLLSADLYYQAATVGEPRTDPVAFPWGYYTYAALGYASLGFTELAQSSLVPVAQHVGNLRGDELRGALAAIIVDLPNFDGSSAFGLGEILRDIAHTAVWQIVVEYETVPWGLMLGLHQAAKGPELGSWWRIDGPVALPMSIQHFIARLQDLGQWAVGSDANLLDEADDRPHGRDDSEIARNLRRTVSSLIDAELSRRSTPLVDDQYLWAKAPTLLDDRTVLLTWFLPRFVNGAVVLFAVTRQGRWLLVTLGEGKGATRHPVADLVESIRDEVQRDPLFADVTPEGVRLLELGGNLTGDHWSEWRAQGKDRLLVWPHGAVHYLPIALCHNAGRLIADDWTVTTIAGLESLVSVDGRARQYGTTVLASAAGGVPFGMHNEPALEEHARMVADAIGAEAVTGAGATRARLLAALSTSDVVHIAVHGTMDQDAPWLQCLYLTPDNDDDGRVFAYDFLGVDLRGVRLVTLAACESALGRFDHGDNVRGIPSALITAGAQAVVGCLWPVRPAPVAYFYHHMHRRIAEGADPVAAFREAQLTTRIQHPQYRDWGAFTYLHGRNKGVTA